MAFDSESWSNENAGFFDSLTAAEVATVIEIWRDAAESASGIVAVELAGPFQRHFTARGTGVPTNFALILTADEAVACKLDPARTEHPLIVGADQFGAVEARWPRGSLRVVALEPGKLATGVRFEPDGAKPIPARTPRLNRNPAAAAVIVALGGELPRA